MARAGVDIAREREKKFRERPLLYLPETEVAPGSAVARTVERCIRGLLHLWELQDCSLYTNALVYSPPSAPHASPWPGLVGRTSASMTLVAGPPVPTSEVAFRALRALNEASVGTAAHRGDTERATAARTA